MLKWFKIYFDLILVIMCKKNYPAEKKFAGFFYIKICYQLKFKFFAVAIFFNDVINIFVTASAEID